MADEITIKDVKAFEDPSISDSEKKLRLDAVTAKYADGSFPILEEHIRRAIAEFCSSMDQVPADLCKSQLVLLRIILRDRDGSDLDCFVSLLKTLIRLAALDGDGSTLGSEMQKELLLEAGKCLVNLLFTSAKARKIFQNKTFEQIIARINALLNVLKRAELENASRLVYLHEFTKSDQQELFLYDLKIVFVLTAQERKLQSECVNDIVKIKVFQRIILFSINELLTNNFMPTLMTWKYLNESLKILFNFYHNAKMFDLEIAQTCSEYCAQIIKKKEFDSETIQNAVNLLAVIQCALPNLCPKVDPVNKCSKETLIQEGYDMSFVNAFLYAFENQIDLYERGGSGTLSEHLAMFLTALNYLCSEHKAARRFCRMKVIPPLKAKHVERRPDEGLDFRNKIIRLMTRPSRAGELAAEFLFVLCKRSVGRLIKYCGFGHSAGLLANYGFLGQALGPRHPSDSEDSETEDYKEVEERINPVTGFIPSEEKMDEMRKHLESMSEEQKEYEMMKLVDCMDKLMDQGMIAPGTIGEDGRPRQVKHVAELLKDAKSHNEDSDSD